MAVIINIETSSKHCSLAVAEDGILRFEKTDRENFDHARSLAVFVKEALEAIHENNLKPDAVAVSIGPGSYTGLRIGLSMAKGLCFALDVPLIGLSTLMILAVKAMFSNQLWEGDELILPMIDARRMEVYASLYDFRLNPLIPPGAFILDENSFTMLKDKGKIIFIGDGTEKFKSIYKNENAIWLNEKDLNAKDMIPLAEKYFLESKFIDIAYSKPEYLKQYDAKIAENKVLKEIRKN